MWTWAFFGDMNGPGPAFYKPMLSWGSGALAGATPVSAMPRLESQAEGAQSIIIGVTQAPLYNAAALEKTFNQPFGATPRVDPSRSAFWGKNCALLAAHDGQELFMLLDQTLAREGQLPENWRYYLHNPRKLRAPVPESSATAVTR